MRTTVYAATPGARTWPRISARLLVGVVAIPLAVYLMGLVLHLAAVLPFPYPTHYEEGVVLGGAITLLQGGDLYANNLTAPYSSPIYTPLHYALFSGPVAIFGPHLVAPRVILLLGTGLLALLVYWWVGYHTRDRRASLVAAAVLFTFFPVANWAAAVRADTVAVCLSLAGAYLVDRHYRDRWLWLAVPLLVLAFYTKQNQLAAPLAAGLFLLLAAPGRAVRFGAAYLSLLGGTFLVLDLSTRHGLFRHLFLDSQANAPAWQHGKLLYKTYVQLYAGYLLLAAGGTVALVRRMRTPFLAIYLVTSVLGTATALVTGSDFNHFMENAAVLSVLAGIGFARALAAKAAWLPAGAAAVLALQLAARVPSVVPGLEVPWLAVPGTEGRGAGVTEPPLWMGTPNSVARTTGDRLVAEFAAARGPVLSELSAFPLLAGRRSDLDDPFLLAAMARTGRWDQDAFVARLEAGEIAPIALLVDVRVPGLHHSRLTDEMIAAIREHYRLKETLPFPGLDGPWIYLYQPLRGDSPATRLPDGATSAATRDPVGMDAARTEPGKGSR